MPARQPLIRWSVRLSVARLGGWRAWLVVNGDFERDLAGQASDAILAPHVEAESRRGRDFVRVTIAMTVTAPDVAQAMTAAWWTFRKAVGNDTEGWDMATATAEIRPEGTLARCIFQPNAPSPAVTSRRCDVPTLAVRRGG
jgi:hypothetical protein